MLTMVVMGDLLPDKLTAIVNIFITALAVQHNRRLLQ